MKNSSKVLGFALGILLLFSTGVNVIALRYFFADNYSPAANLDAKGLNDREAAGIQNMPAIRADFAASGVVSTVKKVLPAVVSITATKDIPVIRQQRFSAPFSDPFFQQFFGPDMQGLTPEPKSDENAPPNTAKKRVQVSGGSGFMYSSDGLIMTNKHVVADENSEYTVTLNDGTEFKGEVLARDPINDIAIVKIALKEGEKLPTLTPLTFGNSDELQVGEQVIAIGNPLEFKNTVTTGIISGLSRNIVAGAGNDSEQLQDLLQTDAAINFGNSGGPLVNSAGEVVGMNTAIASGAEGIGFAIPANALKKIAESVAKNGKIVRPFLGVQYVMLSPEVAKKLKVDATEGALLIGNTDSGLAVIKGSPAEKAGLKEGDVILSIDGEKVSAQKEPREIINNKEVGQKIEIEIERDSKKQKIGVTLAEFK